MVLAFRGGHAAGEEQSSEQDTAAGPPVRHDGPSHGVRCPDAGYFSASIDLLSRVTVL